MKIKVKPTYDFGVKIVVKGSKEKKVMTKYKYAVVEFLSSKDKETAQGYTYQNKIGAKKYDSVVVPTRYGLSLAVVVKLTDKLETYHNQYAIPEIKEIAEVVASKEVAKLMIERKRKDIKKKLEAEVKKMDDIARFELYAEKSPAFAKLLKELKDLEQ